MEKSTIGVNAGKIWRILNNCDAATFEQILSQSGLDAKDVYLAIGWLSRENKIEFLELNDVQLFCLDKNFYF
jgi:hypothetical protein